MQFFSGSTPPLSAGHCDMRFFTAVADSTVWIKLPDRSRRS
jgi:hypothetical protein